jgi:hypothetical protein
VRWRDVVMIGEGSVLPFAGAGPFGEMVEVTPPTRPDSASQILRWGFALPLALPPPPAKESFDESDCYKP